MGTEMEEVGGAQRKMGREMGVKVSIPQRNAASAWTAVLCSRNRLNATEHEIDLDVVLQLCNFKFYYQYQL